MDISEQLMVTLPFDAHEVAESENEESQENVGLFCKPKSHEAS